MIVQEFIEWDQFVRCLCLGQRRGAADEVRPAASGVTSSSTSISRRSSARASSTTRSTLVRALGYDMNSVEWAVRDGVPVRDRLHEPGAGHGRQLAHAALLRVGGDAHGRHGDPAREREPRRSATKESSGSEHAVRGDAAVTAHVDAYPRAAHRRGRAGDRRAMLDEQLRRRGLFFGDRALCTVLRPRLLRAERSADAGTRASTVAAARVRARRTRALGRAAGGPPQFRLDGLGGAAASRRIRASATASPHVAARCVLRRRGRRHGASPSTTPRRRPAPAYNDALTEVFLDLPVMRRFMRAIATCVRCPRGTACCTRCSTACGSSRAHARAPRIAIVDWREVPTRSEFSSFEHYFREQGLSSCESSIRREVEYRDGRLYAAGDADRRSSTSACCFTSWSSDGGLDQPIVRAVRDGAVCMVNPFRCKILHKKASLAVLSDERNAQLFDAEERDERFATTSRGRASSRSGATEHRGDARSTCVPFIAEHREQLVLKPNDEYGGKGIVLGWDGGRRGVGARGSARARASRTSCRSALRSPTEPYPSLVDGKRPSSSIACSTPRRSSRRAIRVDGCLTRLSTSRAAERHRRRRKPRRPSVHRASAR